MESYQEIGHCENQKRSPSRKKNRKHAYYMTCASHRKEGKKVACPHRPTMEDVPNERLLNHTVARTKRMRNLLKNFLNVCILAVNCFGGRVINASEFE